MGGLKPQYFCQLPIRATNQTLLIRPRIFSLFEYVGIFGILTQSDRHNYEMITTGGRAEHKMATT